MPLNTIISEVGVGFNPGFCGSEQPSAIPSYRRKSLKTKMSHLSAYLLISVLLISSTGLSACTPGCPRDGKWKTDQTTGLIGFQVSSCQIILIVTLDGNSLGSQFGSAFAQEALAKSGGTQTGIYPTQCSFESNGQFTCQKDYLTLTGQFLSGDKAQGELVLPQGLDIGAGFSISHSIKSEWSAIPVK